MKRFALLLAATALATPAFAADIITEEPPAPAPVEIAPAYNWTGLYVGGQAGVAFGGSSGAIGSSAGSLNALGIDTFQDDSGAGFTGGVHVGYDYQLPNNVILGGVVDFNYIDNDRTVGASVPGVLDYSNKVDLDYFGTVRGKVGYAFDRVAVYGTGGLAYGNPKNKVRGQDETAAALGATGFSTDTDKDSIGYTVGAGVDFLATEKISVGLEYLYTDLGKAKSSTTYTDVPGIGDLSVDTKTDVDFHTVMAKASYRFN